MRWILPVKDLDRGKSRLHVPAVPRPDLIAAMLRDTLEAVLAADVGTVVLVSPDDRVEELAAQYGVDFLRDGRSLNVAISAAWVGRSAALLPDLPAVLPTDLREVVIGNACGFVPDAAGTGTTLVFGVDVVTHFGPGSAAAHLSAGLPRIEGAPGLRRDVDTAADLALAQRLGLGVHTAALLTRGRPAPPGTGLPQ